PCRTGRGRLSRESVLSADSSGGRWTHSRHPTRGSSSPTATAPDRGARRDGSGRDRKSTRLNSSHVSISYAVFCLKKKKTRTKKTCAVALTRPSEAYPKSPLGRPFADSTERARTYQQSTFPHRSLHPILPIHTVSR